MTLVFMAAFMPRTNLPALAGQSLNLRKASEELGLSLRQMKRVRKRYLDQEKRGLISLKRGKTSNRKFDHRFRCGVVKLMKEKYVDFGPTLATEKLEELNGLKLSAETLRKWLIEEELWRPKRKKRS